MKKFFVLSAIASVAIVGCGTPTKMTAQNIPTTKQHVVDVDELISFHEERVKRDPGGAIGWRMLGETYLSKSERNDLPSYALKAEEAGFKSLALRRKRNEEALILVAKAHLAQHEFRPALGFVESAIKSDPQNQIAKRLEVEILLELGEYAAAETKLKRMPQLVEDPSGISVLARFFEIKGNTKLATRLHLASLAKVAKASWLSGTTRAWFKSNYGDFLYRTGLFDQAIVQYQAALDYDSDFYKAMAGLTRCFAEKSNWDAVIEWGTETIKIARMTDIQGLIADAYREAGNSKLASSIYEQIQAENGGHKHSSSGGHGHESSHGHTHDRLFAMFLADRKLDPELAVHLASEDLENRRDIYSYDAVAWAKLAAGDVQGAKQAIDQACATGSKDFRILRHREAIYAKLK